MLIPAAIPLIRFDAGISAVMVPPLSATDPLGNVGKHDGCSVLEAKPIAPDGVDGRNKVGAPVAAGGLHGTRTKMLVPVRLLDESSKVNLGESS